MKNSKDILMKFISTQGYKRNSPDVNRPLNVIPSGRITMQDVDFPVRGVDNLGNEMFMVPGGEYYFPGDYVVETPMMQRGGQHGGLDRWFAEKWVDIKTGKECGRQEGEKRAGYPACRPSKRVSEDTPKTASELSSSEKEKFKRSKTSSERISYQHKRKQDGGEWLDKYENTKENRQKVDQLFGLPAAGNVNYVPVVESLVGGFSAGLAKNALAPVVKSSLRSLQKYMEMQENPFVKIDLPVFNEAKNWLNKYDD